MERTASSTVVTSLFLLAAFGQAFGWEYHDPAPNSQMEAVASHPSGSIVATGSLGFQSAVVMLDAGDGAELWRTTYGPGFHGNAIAFDAAGDIAVSRGSNSTIRVVKFDAATGAILWDYDTLGGRAMDLAADGSGGFVVVGRLDSGDTAVVKLDGATGAEVWQHTIEGPTTGAVTVKTASVAVDASGDVFVGTAIDSDFAVVKVDGLLGTEAWRVQLDPGAASGLATTAAGDVVAIGEIDATGIVAMMLDGATGTEIWRRDEPAGGEARVVAIDSAGDVIVGGCITASSPTVDFLVWKLNGSTGADLWLTSFGAKQGFIKSSCANDVAVAPTGDVYAAGFGGGTHFGDRAVVKLDGTDGTEVWRRVRDGRVRIARVALDSDGDVVATSAYEFRVTEMTPDDGIIGPVSGALLVARDVLGAPDRRRITAKLKDPLIATPAPGSAGDPTINGGALLLANPLTGESATFSLPASGWIGRGKPRGSKGYRYVGGAGEACSRVTIAPGRLLKVTCIGKKGPIPFSFDEPTQGRLDVSLQLGNGRPQCASFGGEIQADVGTSNPGPQARFKAKDAPTPVGDCAEP